MMDKFNLREKHDEEYVDIHGRHIPAVLIKKTGEVAFPLTELQQTGVAIFKKSQYVKLSTVEKQFDENFHLFMLDSAKRYMLENKIPFPEQEIINTINSCKTKLLAINKKHSSPPNNFFKDRHVKELPDNEILIQVNVSPSSSSSTQSGTGNRKVITSRFPKQSPKNLVLKDSNATQDRTKTTDGDENVPKTEGDGGSKTPKLRPPKSKVLEKIPLDETLNREHNVIVTCIYKRNCIWVKDKANEELFVKIHDMVNQEATHRKPVPRPWRMEKMYMAEDGGAWFRCKLHKFKPLTVFFVDYGNVVEVDEIRDVSEELALVPCMAVRLTFMENEYNPRLEDEITIKIIKQNEDSTYFVNVLKQIRKHEEEPRIFCKVPPPLTALENGQTVVIVHVENGLFFLRTKECFQKLKQVEMQIENHLKSAQSLKTVKIGQLILVPGDDKHHRAVVTFIKPKKVDVKYLDHHRKATVDRDSLKNINEQLSLEPVTYFKAGKLKGFESRNFSDEDKALIEEVTKKRKKFAVVLDDEGNFDLFDSYVHLSEQLGQPKSQRKLRLQDMQTYRPEFGLKPYLCGFYKSSNEFSMVPSEALESHIDSVLITEIKDPEPYTPTAGEVCYCYFIDQWYRCLVSRVLNGDFEVILLDFGNVELVTKNDFRKPDESITDVPVLALPCKLINLPDHPNVEDLLKKKVLGNELYEVNVKSIDDGKYSVEIPLVYEQIMMKSS